MLASLLAQLQASQQEALQLKLQLAGPSGVYRLRGPLAGVPAVPSVAAPSPPTPTVVTPLQPTKVIGGPGLTPPKVPVPLFGPGQVNPCAGVADQGEKAKQAKGMVQALRARISNLLRGARPSH